jgi:hypothetical protein
VGTAPSVAVVVGIWPDGMYVDGTAPSVEGTDPSVEMIVGIWPVGIWPVGIWPVGTAPTPSVAVTAGDGVSYGIPMCSVGVSPGEVLLQVEIAWQTWMHIWNLILMQAKSWI